MLVLKFRGQKQKQAHNNSSQRDYTEPPETAGGAVNNTNQEESNINSSGPFTPFI